jgi:hypothetical protein
MDTSDTILPRHVLCILGKSGDFERLKTAAQAAMAAVAPGFELDDEYSVDEPDERMERAFAVCWDRVSNSAWESDDAKFESAWHDSDEQAVAEHGCVVYLMGPRMQRHEAAGVSFQAMLLVERMIEGGATAVKGESAGVSHGIARWKELAAKARAAHAAGDVVQNTRWCRIGLTKRPLDADPYFESVGYHLVGLPEICIEQPFESELGEGALAASIFMDEVADMLAEHGQDAVLAKHPGRWVSDSDYEEDSFKFNPYGSILLNESADEEQQDEQPAPEPEPESVADQPKRGLLGRLFGK